MSIYIFSRPVHSGKTTELIQWHKQHKVATGVLMPDIQGSRKIMDLKTGELFDITCSDETVGEEAIVRVGSYRFYTLAFDKANAIIMNALAENPGWLIIDEAGKLELGGKGFYSSLTKAIAFYDKPEQAGKLLITVRESLAEEIRQFFNIKNCQIIHQLDGLF